MSLSKKSVAELAQEIRRCRVMAQSIAGANSSSIYACFVGGLEAVFGHFVEKHGKDSTEVRQAFEYQPTADEVREYQEQRERRNAEYADRIGVTP